MLDKISLFAPAKLNIFLKVLGRRPDGMHIIRSGITFINLFDKITIKKSEKMNISYSGSFAPLGNSYKDCILSKTLEFLNLDRQYQFEINIEKNIPVQGGLGSASTNAASFIKALEKFNIIEEKKPEYFVTLGTDIPCFLYNKNCLVTGIGENIYSQTFPRYFFLLVKPNFKHSTKEMYEKLNFSKGSYEPTVDLEEYMITEEDNGNDFESNIKNKNIEFKNILEFLETLEENIFIRMTGSGSCCYATFESEEYANKAQILFKNNFPELWSAVVHNNI